MILYNISRIISSFSILIVIEEFYRAKFIKSKHNLFLKFSNESKNDFINIEKTIKKFKSGLDIDLKKVLDEKEIKKINELLLKRNVIVHNNGYADMIFINQSGIKCNLGELIPVTDEDSTIYSSIIISVVEKIEKEFEKIIYPEIDIRIEDF